MNQHWIQLGMDTPKQVARRPRKRTTWQPAGQWNSQLPISDIMGLVKDGLRIGRTWLYSLCLCVGYPTLTHEKHSWYSQVWLTGNMFQKNAWSNCISWISISGTRNKSNHDFLMVTFHVGCLPTSTKQTIIFVAHLKGSVLSPKANPC